MAETSLSGSENLHTLVSVRWCILCFQMTLFKEHITQESVNHEITDGNFAFLFNACLWVRLYDGSDLKTCLLT